MNIVNYEFNYGFAKSVPNVKNGQNVYVSALFGSEIWKTEIINLSLHKLCIKLRTNFVQKPKNLVQKNCVKTKTKNMYNYAVIDREMVVRADAQPLTSDDLLALRAYAEAEGKACLDLFEESANDIRVLALNSRDLLPEGYELQTIRQHFATSDDAEILRTSRAKALAGWRALTQYCGRCGHRLEEHPTLTARQCPECGNLIFPRIEPCIITVVSRGDGKILLAKHVQRNQNIYACIAGFVEAGETVEHAVEREVMEETGLRIRNIRYYGSQSWPFPAQLMLGFTAELDGGELHLQADELAEARWFDRNDCPASPPPGSIAYRLIHQC